MANRTINLTMLWVADEIAQILDNEQEYFEYGAFLNSRLYKELMTYTLSRVPNVYAAIEDGQKLSEKCNRRYCSGERKLHIETVIRQGIFEILRRKRDWIKHQLPSSSEQSFSPSTWFT
ncbi:hypothetical protein [Coleofasciculus sp. FACHB-542]|uniref:hypothetical protein n=1 Tax=Coleofasciculus sp. FACHB-542 TaxID=2692787 RepID=UPI001686C42A|nr:hypothetical protein [Coleofasciculus sp. FACHB-542]MBD2084294.1 hypothetical protein [Coleofasciculus sp. FACHB-542]